MANVTLFTLTMEGLNGRRIGVGTTTQNVRDTFTDPIRIMYS